jgi:hypothetical protein
VDRREELTEAEDRAWKDFHELVSRFRDDELELPGANPDGWSVKDVIWHIGCWIAEAAQQLQRMRLGTYEDRDWNDTDEINARILEEGRRQDMTTVRSELTAARTRALQEWAALETLTPEAEEWFSDIGPAHYDDHKEELSTWAEELERRRG